MKNVFDVIKRPLFTEKGSALKEAENKVLLEVAKDANKIEIKKAVEELFKVKVEKVSTIKAHGKMMYWMGISSNLMSLAGIAISIGVLVDGAIVEVENAYKKLERWEEEGRPGDFHQVRLEALLEVGPSVFFSLLLIAVAFLPIFTLVDHEGRLFKPLAWTKNLTMFVAAFLALTLDPAMRMSFTRMDWVSFRPLWLSWLFNQATAGRYHPEERHPISRVLFAFYEPGCRFVLRWPKATIAAALAVLAATVPVYFRVGHEFMPPLSEGTILYMPTTLPGISVTERWITFFNEDTEEFPEWIDPAWHNSLIGCMKCQLICPVDKHFAKSVGEGEDFNETEIDLILNRVPPERLPPETAHKLSRSYMVDYLDVLARNLRALMR